MEGTYLRDILANTASEVTVRQMAMPLADVDLLTRAMPDAVDMTGRLRGPGGNGDALQRFKPGAPQRPRQPAWRVRRRPGTTRSSSRAGIAPKS